jgi:hypothetical protein
MNRKWNLKSTCVCVCKGADKVKAAEKCTSKSIVYGIQRIGRVVIGVERWRAEVAVAGWDGEDGGGRGRGLERG